MENFDKSLEQLEQVVALSKVSITTKEYKELLRAEMERDLIKEMLDSDIGSYQLKENLSLMFPPGSKPESEVQPNVE